jgi:ABC-type sugar transport system ATPase subunit
MVNPVTAPPLLRMLGISKSFSGVPVLRNVDFGLDPGEIVCLLGENGAGKSTLMKILTGVHAEYGGQVLFEGREVRFRSTADAYARGISIVFQEFNLCPNLSAMENLFLGQEHRGPGGLFSYAKTREAARAAFRDLGVEIDPDPVVRDLGVAQQQMIEIAKALSHKPKILVMDEPTAPLTGKEIDILFRLMRDLKSRGIAIVFISHKLKEVLTISDRVVCLRDGEVSGTVDTKSATENSLVSMMVGREIDRLYSRRKGHAGEEVVLEVQGLSGPPRIRDVSFRVRKGEIVGLAGLIGAGRTEVARLIVGADKKTSGRLLLEGREVRIGHPADAVALGIGYVTEDRKKRGLVLPMTVRENVTLSIHRLVSNACRVFRGAAEREVADRYIADLRMKVTGREQVTRNLSGGNQQKVLLAKWLAIRPKLLILDEPTRGIDVGAKAEIHRIITELADGGMSILVISSELPEVLHLSDRILVMHEGRLTADIPRDKADEETVMKAAVA